MIHWLGKIKGTLDYFCKTHLLATEKKSEERKIRHSDFPGQLLKLAEKNHIREYFLISKQANKSHLENVYHN